MVRWRPPYGGRGGAGSKGSTIAFSWFGTRSSTRVVMASDPARPALEERSDVLDDPHRRGTQLVVVEKRVAVVEDAGLGREGELPGGPISLGDGVAEGEPGDGAFSGPHWHRLG